MGNSKNLNLGALDGINKKVSANVNNSNDVNKNISNDKNISTDSNSSSNNYSYVSNNISNDNDRNVIRNVSSSNNRNIDGNINGNIVINKPVANEKTKRASYYLKEKTISDIEKLAKKSGMGISEFLQYFLDLTLDKIEIR